MTANLTCGQAGSLATCPSAFTSPLEANSLIKLTPLSYAGGINQLGQWMAIWAPLAQPITATGWKYSYIFSSYVLLCCLLNFNCLQHCFTQLSLLNLLPDRMTSDLVKVWMGKIGNNKKEKRRKIVVRVMK